MLFPLNNLDQSIYGWHLNKRKIITILLLTFAIVSSYSQLTIQPDRANAYYQSGETAQFIITSNISGSASYTFKYDNYAPVISTGTINLIAGIPQIISYTSPDANVVLCEVTQNSNRAISGVAFSPYEIESFEPKPSDLNAFWTTKKQELANIPMNPVVELHSSNDYSTTYSVTLDNIDGRKVYGYLSIPDGTGPFPAVVTLPPFGYIPNITTPEYSLAERAGVLSFTVSIHNVLPNETDPNAYQPDAYEDENLNYYKYGLLGAVRAIDYLFTRSDFDLQNIGATGVSQGGGLSIALAGIDDRINLLMYSVPALCQNAGLAHDKAGGFPNYVNRSRSENGSIEHETASINATRYYDGVFLAESCDYPVMGFTSYQDEITPAATGFAAFNALPKSAPRVLMHSINLGHQNAPEYFSGRFEFIHRHFPSSVATTPFPWNNNSGYHIDAGTDAMIPFGEDINLTANVEFQTTSNPDYQLEWSVVDGPGTVNFSNANSYNTNATFSNEGEYLLQFTALDTSKLHSDNQYFTLIDYVTVTVESLFALPIELVSFSSTLRDDQVHLSWKTSTEIDNKGFEIQRTEKLDQPYTSIGWVDGINATNGADYKFLDKNIASGKTYYYRLKQFDFDESYSFSPIVAESIPLSDFKVNIHPNPVTDKLQISLTGNDSYQGTLKIISTLGHILQNEKIDVVGKFEKNLDVKHLSKGTYFLWLELNNRDAEVFSFYKM